MSRYSTIDPQKRFFIKISIHEDLKSHPNDLVHPTDSRFNWLRDGHYIWTDGVLGLWHQPNSDIRNLRSCRVASVCLDHERRFWTVNYNAPQAHSSTASRGIDGEEEHRFTWAILEFERDEVAKRYSVDHGPAAFEYVSRAAVGARWLRLFEGTPHVADLPTSIAIRYSLGGNFAIIWAIIAFRLHPDDIEWGLLDCFSAPKAWSGNALNRDGMVNHRVVVVEIFREQNTPESVFRDVENGVDSHILFA
ncbi:hypothetical protein RUND412_008392 [Rhizina undulata]